RIAAGDPREDALAPHVARVPPADVFEPSDLVSLAKCRSQGLVEVDRAQPVRRLRQLQPREAAREREVDEGIERDDVRGAYARSRATVLARPGTTGRRRAHRISVH